MSKNTILVKPRSSVGISIRPPCCAMGIAVGVAAIVLRPPGGAELAILRPCVPILIAMRISCGAIGGGQVLAMRIADRT